MEKKRTVLIVDDSPGPRSALQMILEPFYTVYTAADGTEALQCFQREKIDLVTLDLEMPGISGFEVLQEMKNLKEDVPVIIITAHNNLPRIREVISQGAVNFLSKPFVIHEVTSVVRKALSLGGKEIAAATP